MATKRFSNTQKIIKENLSKFPENQPGFYRIKSAQGEILYIGIVRSRRLDEQIYLP